jgi:hypothetical protein
LGVGHFFIFIFKDPHPEFTKNGLLPLEHEVMLGRIGEGLK